MPAVNYVCPQGDRVAGDEDVAALKIEVSEFEAFYHRPDVPHHVVVTLAGQVCDLAAGHGDGGGGGSDESVHEGVLLWAREGATDHSGEQELHYALTPNEVLPNDLSANGGCLTAKYIDARELPPAAACHRLIRRQHWTGSIQVRLTLFLVLLKPELPVVSGWGCASVIAGNEHYEPCRQ